MAQITHTNTTIGKPITLRAIFILNALKAILAFTLYFVFTNKAGHEPIIDPQIILYTASAYVVLFGFMVRAILTKNLIALRLLLIIDFIVSIPAKAYIGFAVAIISLGLSFTNTVKRYFQQ